MPLAQRLPLWSVPRLQQALTRGAAQLTVAEREAVGAELVGRGAELPPDPAESGFLQTVEGWRDGTLVHAYLDPAGEFDWRQRFAIEQELARRELGIPHDAGAAPTALRSLEASWSLFLRRPGSFLLQGVLSGLALISAAVVFGIALSAYPRGLGLGTALLVPLMLLVLALITASYVFAAGRQALVLSRTDASPALRARRGQPLLTTTVTWGVAWLLYLAITILVFTTLPELLAGLLSLAALALSATSAFLAQSLALERGLTPLAAYHVVGRYWRRHPFALSWLTVVWGGVWALILVGPTLPAVFLPCCLICASPLLTWTMIPITACGWAQVHADLSGAFPPRAAPLEPWCFPGLSLPPWLLRLCCGLLALSVWASLGGFALVSELTQLLSLDHSGLEGWAPLAALGGVAALPALLTLGLLSHARQRAGGLVLSAEGLRLDVTDRWSGHVVPWERVSGFRLSEAGVRLVLRRRPWTVWTGPLVPARDREAHELVEQLEAWGVSRDEH